MISLAAVHMGRIALGTNLSRFRLEVPTTTTTTMGNGDDGMGRPWVSDNDIHPNSKIPAKGKDN